MRDELGWHRDDFEHGMDGWMDRRKGPVHTWGRFGFQTSDDADRELEW